MPRRILLLITDLEIGGTPTVVRELAIRLNDPPEVEISVACLKKWGPNADRLRDAGIPVTAFGAQHFWHLPGTIWQLQDMVQRRNIDTVFSFLFHANIIAALAVGELRGRVRLLQSMQTGQEFPRWHWWVQWRFRDAAETIVVPSAYVADAAEARSRIERERFVVIPNAIDASALLPHPVFAGDTVRVGFLGRMDPVKRLPVAMRAVEEIAEFPVQMLIFGDGPYRNAWQRWQQSELSDPVGQRFIWRGQVPSPQEALSEMDVLVLPSTEEGFGLVLIEAMAGGVPVIASAAGGAAEVVRHEYNGLLVPPGAMETRGFADAIRRLHADPDLRNQLIANGLAEARTRFTWENVLPKYREVLRI